MFEKEAEEAIMKKYQPSVQGYKNLIKNWKEGAVFGYDKANEWHRDEVPENENDILCQVAKDDFVVGYYHQSKKRYYTTDGQDIDVIAWKEIIPPKQEE